MIPTDRPSKKCILRSLTRKTCRDVFHDCTVLNRQRRTAIVGSSHCKEK
jgi:hypothetical protein